MERERKESESERVRDSGSSYGQVRTKVKRQACTVSPVHMAEIRGRPKVREPLYYTQVL